MEDLLPYGYNGFAISKKNYRDTESQAIVTTCSLKKIPFKIFNSFKEVPDDFIPVGDIGFVEGVFGENVIPDYYPEYLKGYLKRNVWRQENWPLGKIVFIKPADKYKRFTGFVTNGGYRKKKRGPYICSDVIKIKNEWRYYVCKGEILFSNWYAGIDDIEIISPKLDIVFENDLCCCLDMGENIDGEIVLIEQQHPYSCGWYGKNTPENSEIYTRWIAYGWDYLKREIKK